ncbi:MAG: CTB family bacteriocin [Calothrix sp. MO_167.B12]|nr:CTB family bacteriocin [Calothrix sp. MO_167.B12]
MLSNKSKLFVEISEEQQEVVAGGNIGLFQASFADYEYEAIGNIGTSVAGPGGGAAGSVTQAVDIDSTAGQGVALFVS